jgi:ApeA N-terminal domain 1/Apea-like HEPN
VLFYGGAGGLNSQRFSINALRVSRLAEVPLMQDRNMFNEFSIRGRWWLPNNPNDQVPGTMHFSNDSLKLRLDRTFWVQELIQAHSVGSYKTEVILGQTTAGEPCTVLRLFYLSSIGDEVVLGGNALFLGAHFNQEDELSVNKVLLGFTHLEDWTGQSLIQELQGSNKDHFSIKVPTVPTAIFKIEDCPQFKNLALWHGMQVSRKRTQTTLRTQSHFVVDFDPPSNIVGINRVIRAIANLLSLLVGDSVLPKKVHLIAQLAPAKPDRSIEYLVPSRIPLLSEKSEFEMVFPLRDFHDDGTKVENLFREWFQKEPVLRPVSDLLLSTIHNRSQYFQSAFLSLAQGLESFHRKTCGGTYLSKEEYANVRKILASAVPPETPQQLKEKLLSTFAYANEFSLKTRIRQLLESIHLQHAVDLTGNSNLQEFIKLFTDIRNYLTHYDENGKPPIVDSAIDMYNLNQRLRAILTMLLFKYLGLEENRLFLPLKSHLRLF